MQVFVKTKKVGGSIMARIPKDVVEELGLKPNETVELTVKRPKKSYFGIAKGLGEFTEDDRFDRH